MWKISFKSKVNSIGGSVVEFSPASCSRAREARVQFPADAFRYFCFYKKKLT